MATAIELLDQIDAASANLRTVVTTEEAALATTQDALATAQAQLAATQTVLSDTQTALTAAQAEIANLKSQIITTVPAGGDLQAALNKAGKIQLTAGATYTGHFILKSGTTLLGNGAKIDNNVKGYPTLDVPIKTTDVYASDLVLSNVDDQQVVLVGRNDTSQTTLDVVPRRITFERCSIPTYRGKHAFDIHGAEVVLQDCSVADAWDPALRDSQAIGIINTPGPVRVSGGSFSAGSEIIMTGGDTIKIPGIVPTGLVFENLKLWRPLSWQTDGIKRGIKNCLELKSGVDVTIRNVEMDGCWRDGQDGWAFMITPKNGAWVQNLTVDNVRATNVAGFLAITGVDFTAATPPPRTKNVVVKNCSCVASMAKYGGRGAFLLVTQNPEDLTFDNNTHIGDSTTIQTEGTVPVFNMTNSRMILAKYCVFTSGDGLSGQAYANNLAAAFGTYNISGNTFAPVAYNNADGTVASVNSTAKKNLPGNTFVSRATFDTLIASA